MKHFWRCTSTPLQVLEAWRSARRKPRFGGGTGAGSSSGSAMGPMQHHANSCEFMGGQGW